MNETTAGADASVEALKLYVRLIYLLNLHLQNVGNDQLLKRIPKVQVNGCMKQPGAALQLFSHP